MTYATEPHQSPETKSRPNTPSDERGVLDSPVSPVSPATTSKKKKKKKKASKKAHAQSPDTPIESPPQPGLCISRNKHWRFISSFHGPWLQLPTELLDSLVRLNLESANPNNNWDPNKASRYSDQPPLPDFVTQELVKLSNGESVPLPPPIDHGVFKSIASIRRLVDEASDLAVRAASGTSAASASYANAWGAAQTFGLYPNDNRGGRNVAMSAMRLNRLRAIAVQRLAEAYKADEIATSVMVMQGGTALDDIAERVLKNDPQNADAQYVHFFHEKIPSRQLVEATSLNVLNRLIAAYPDRLEYLRTRGVVQCFQEEFMKAVKDFTHVLKEIRNIRKANTAHDLANTVERKLGKSGKKSRHKATSGQAPPSGTASPIESPDGDYSHFSQMPESPQPLESQCLFMRGIAYLHHAIHLIEQAMLHVEGIEKPSLTDVPDFRLSDVLDGKYGGVEHGSRDGPLGPRDGKKELAYIQAFSDPSLREQVSTSVKRSIRDHEKFISQFQSLDSGVPIQGTLAERVTQAFALTEYLRPGSPSAGSHSSPVSNMRPTVYTSYHPLLVESHFNRLIAVLLTGAFTDAASMFCETARAINGLEGYPVFLPAKSMAQAEFIEVLERLGSDWNNGDGPKDRERLAIEPPLQRDERAQQSSQNGKQRASSSQIEDTNVVDAVESLNSLRILLAPAIQRQRETQSGAGRDRDPNLPPPVNIPLHGPRVEIILAWLAGAYLPVLNAVA